MTTTTVLTTRRLRLRAWRAADAAAFNVHCNTDAVMEYLGGVVSRAQLRREVEWYIADHKRHGHTFWVIERKRDKAFIGFSGIIRVPERGGPLWGKLEIGWRVRADKWRHGYAYEAARAVVEWAEWEAAEPMLYARIDRGNAASQGLARKLGMHRARALEARQRGEDKCLLIFCRAL